MLRGMIRVLVLVVVAGTGAWSAGPISSATADVRVLSHTAELPVAGTAWITATGHRIDLARPPVIWHGYDSSSNLTYPAADASRARRVHSGPGVDAVAPRTTVGPDRTGDEVF